MSEFPSRRFKNIIAPLSYQTIFKENNENDCTISNGDATREGIGTGEKESGDLLEQFDSIYDSIARRAFELFEANGRWLGNDLDDWSARKPRSCTRLHLEMRESDGSFTVEAEVPGFTAKDIEINVEPRCLRIAGKRETKEEEKRAK